MSASGTVSADQVVDTDRYPLSDPEGPAWRAIVARTRGRAGRARLLRARRLHPAGTARDARAGVRADRPARAHTDRAGQRLQHRARHPAARGPPRPARSWSAATPSSPATTSPPTRSSSSSTPARRSSASSPTASRCRSCTSSPTRCRARAQRGRARPRAPVALRHQRVHRQHADPAGARTAACSSTARTSAPPRRRTSTTSRAVLAGRGEHLVRRLDAAPGRPAAVPRPVRAAPRQHRAAATRPAHRDLRLQRAARRDRQRRSGPASSSAGSCPSTSPRTPSGATSCSTDGRPAGAPSTRPARSPSTTSTPRPTRARYFGTLRELDYHMPQLAKPYFAKLIDGARHAPTVLDVGCSYGVNAALYRVRHHDGRPLRALHRRGGRPPRPRGADRPRPGAAHGRARRPVHRARRVRAGAGVRARGRLPRRRRCCADLERRRPDRRAARGARRGRPRRLDRLHRLRHRADHRPARPAADRPRRWRTSCCGCSPTSRSRRAWPSSATRRSSVDGRVPAAPVRLGARSRSRSSTPLRANGVEPHELETEGWLCAQLYLSRPTDTVEDPQ